MHKFISILISALSLGAFGQSYFVELKTANPLLLREVLEERGIEVEGYSKTKKLLGVITEQPEKLSAIENEFSSHPLYQFRSVRVEESQPLLQYLDSFLTDGIGGYYGPNEVVDELKKLESEFPESAKVLNVTQFLNARKTHEGRDTFALVVGENPSEFQDKPKLLIVAEHHAREITTPHAVIDAARDLLEKAKAGEEWATAALDKVQIVFLPALNPDGLNTVMTEDRMWRKNRNPNRGGSKGVDLNRNYGFKWGTCGMNSNQKSSEVYKGSSADSEPEVLLAQALNKKLHFSLAISYHSYGDEVLMPYLCANLAEANIYNALRDKIQAATTFGHRPPSSSGEDHEWHYNKLGTLAFLLEIGEDFQPAFSTYRQTIWPNVQKVLPLMVAELQNNFVEINVKNREGEAVKDAAILVDSIAFTEGETRTTDSFGTHRWRLPQGSHTLQVKVGNTVKKTVNLESTGELKKVQIQLDE